MLILVPDRTDTDKKDTKFLGIGHPSCVAFGRGGSDSVLQVFVNADDVAQRKTLHTDGMSNNGASYLENNVPE